MSVKRQILQMNEATMPGDVAFMGSVGTAEGEPIWNRMAAIIRKHALDIRLLMDAHDRRNRGFVDVSTFRRSLCYAFGNQWIELAMTSAEFEEICMPYKSRTPHAKGEPEAFIMWQKFASDLQTLANTRRPSQNFLAKLEQVEAKERLDQELQAKWGLDIFTLTSALHAIKERLLTYNTSINKAFQRIDANNNGTVSRAEILAFFKDAHIGNIVSPSTLDVIMAYCDENNDDEVANTPIPSHHLLPVIQASPDAHTTPFPLPPSPPSLSLSLPLPHSPSLPLPPLPPLPALPSLPPVAGRSGRVRGSEGPNCSPAGLPPTRTQINYNELAGLIMAGDILDRGVPEKREIKQEQRVGRAQVPVSQLRKAQKLISASASRPPNPCRPTADHMTPAALAHVSYTVAHSSLSPLRSLLQERLLTKFDSVREALRFIDTDGSGSISRDEIKEMLSRFNLLEYTDFYTGQKRGELSEEVVDTFLEACEQISIASDADVRIDADEFTKVIMAEDIMELNVMK